VGVTANSSKVGIASSPWAVRDLLEVRIRSLSRISGLEPIMVMVPPRMAQKPIGISRRDIGSPVRLDMRLTTGRNRAAAPTFCMKLEMKPTVPEMSGMMRCSVEPPIFMMKAATLLITPVLSRPAPMIITAMMEITALAAKPSNRCWVSTSEGTMLSGITVVRPSNTITSTAATSTRTTSDTKR